MTTDDRPIEDLDLSVCAYSCLVRHGIKTIGALRKLSDEDLLRIRNLSQARIDEIKQSLAAYPCQELVPVVHARWVPVEIDGRASYICDRCGSEMPTDAAFAEITERENRFCYWCGAKMDEEV